MFAILHPLKLLVVPINDTVIFSVAIQMIEKLVDEAAKMLEESKPRIVVSIQG